MSEWKTTEWEHWAWIDCYWIAINMCTHTNHFICNWQGFLIKVSNKLNILCLILTAIIHILLIKSCWEEKNLQCYLIIQNRPISQVGKKKMNNISVGISLKTRLIVYSLICWTVGHQRSTSLVCGVKCLGLVLVQ